MLRHVHHGGHDYITILSDTNEYIGSVPRVVEKHYTVGTSVAVVTSVEVEIFNYFPEIEREMERVYTVGQSTLTLGSRLPPWKE